MKGIGRWIGGCIPSECFEPTQELLKLMKWNDLSVWFCRFLCYLEVRAKRAGKLCWKWTFYAPISLLKVHIEKREKEGDLTQSYDKTPYTNRKLENQRTTHNATKNFDYTTIADRLRTVSWSNKSSNWCG